MARVEGQRSFWNVQPEVRSFFCGLYPLGNDQFAATLLLELHGLVERADSAFHLAADVAQQLIPTLYRALPS